MKSLLAPEAKTGLSTNDIGVIAGYRKQVTTIRLLLRTHGLQNIRVGSVDDYQGQEERVILISTVVSRQHWLHDSNPCNLLSSPPRFNVAITRAKALLCIVGNPHILWEDPCWKALLQFCVRHQCYRGVTGPWLTHSHNADHEADSKEVVTTHMAEIALLGAEAEKADMLSANGVHGCPEMEWRIMT